MRGILISQQGGASGCAGLQGQYWKGYGCQQATHGLQLISDRSRSYANSRLRSPPLHHGRICLNVRAFSLCQCGGGEGKVAHNSIVSRYKFRQDGATSTTARHDDFDKASRALVPSMVNAPSSYVSARGVC